MLPFFLGRKYIQLRREGAFELRRVLQLMSALHNVVWKSGITSRFTTQLRTFKEMGELDEVEFYAIMSLRAFPAHLLSNRLAV